jgi:lysophospholipase L1-like esterase
MPQPERDYLRPRLYVTSPQTGRVRAFQTQWLGAMADLYRNSKTRVIIIQPPRTGVPRPVPLAHFDWTTVDALAKRPWVTIVDRKTFGDLERPELFSDHAHLNAEGQKLFSPALAKTVKSILEGAR